MRRINIRIVIAIATCVAWGVALAGIWLLPRPAVTVSTGAAVTGVVIVKDGDKSLLVKALADACACLRKHHSGS